MIIVRNVFRVLAAIALAVATVAVAGCEREEEHSRVAKSPSSNAVVAPASIDRGRQLYKVNCAPCHGEQGKGDGPAAAAYNPKPRNHTDSMYMSKLTDEDIAKVIQYGGAIKNMPMMPSNPSLKGADLAAVVAYTRSLSAHETAER
jgi:mono/diheme cytochrome c family protein